MSGGVVSGVVSGVGSVFNEHFACYCFLIKATKNLICLYNGVSSLLLCQWRKKEGRKEGRKA